MSATRLRCGGIFNYYFCCKFITESNSEKNLKIVLRCDKVTTMSLVVQLFGTQCIFMLQRSIGGLHCKGQIPLRCQLSGRSATSSLAGRRPAGELVR